MDPSMGDYPPLDGGMEPSMDPHLNPGLLQDLDAEGLPVPGSEHLMEGMFSELHSAVSEGGIPVTAAHFDLQEEMLWTGNHRGHVTSFFGPTMVRHSSFQANAADDIRQIHSLETGVLFLSKCNLKCHTRGGLVMFDYPMDEGADMHSLLMTDNNTVLMGGLQNYAVEFDLNAMQETQKFNVEVPGVAIMRQTGRFFFCGHTSGKITLRDLRSFKTEHEFDAFSGSLSDFDVHGNLLAACGFSSRGMNGLACDRFLMVFDLRMMRAVTPLQVHVDPLFLRFIPTYTSRLAIISQTGQCQFCEPTGLANMADIFHVNAGGQVLMSFDVSSSKQALAFGDSGGIVHLWSDAPEVSFNDYSRESEFALPCIVDSLPQLDWNHDLLPLSLIPTPLTSTEQLLSDWSSAMATPSPRRAPPVDPEILRTMKTVGFIGYAANPRTRPRNQVPYKLKDVELDYDNYNQVPESPIGRDEEPHLYMVPKKYRKVTIKYSKLGLEDFDFKHYNRTLFAGLEPHIPNAYCNCMIQELLLSPVEGAAPQPGGGSCSSARWRELLLSPVEGAAPQPGGGSCSSARWRELLLSPVEGAAPQPGGGSCSSARWRELLLSPVEGAAPQPGGGSCSSARWKELLLSLVELEQRTAGYIPVLYFLEPIRCLVQNHLCQKEFCLACELGFLFHMLDLSRGDPCQASNFLRAFRTIPEASALGLILADSDEQTGKARLGRLIQSWNRFILTQLHQETQEQEGPQAYRGASSSSSLGSSGESAIGKLFGCEVENSSLCRCGKETVRTSLSLLFTVHYPEHNSTDKAMKEYDFAEILKRSICLEQSTQAWCENCEKYQPTVQTRNIRCLPDVLVINCEVNSAKEAEFWKVQAEYAFNKAKQKEKEKQAMEPPKPKEPPPPMPTEWCLDGEDPSSMAGFTFDTKAEDLRHVWIPQSLKMQISKTQGLEVSSWPEGEELSSAEEEEGASVYDLVVTVPHILDARTGGNLVAHIKVGETYHVRKEGVTHQQWYLFNDFLIEPIDKLEAAQFDVSWKVPGLLYYAKRNHHPKYDLRIKNPIDASVLLTEASLARKQRKSHATFIPLMVSEMPQAGELVGLDAEFVTLNQEEAELRSDGTKSTIKPSQMSVARITCVRGQGANEGVPFIDDYISTQEQVVDYLTQYSGIKPGDLDAKISSKHLTTLKSTYLKLRFLIDTGVRFVGHGLQ
ncbi:poly(A)-specific ribonuclease [Dissostichus eleginoides]|nr:poly(A)-specific ribonuclease [Dissostichus eleginoides]